MAMINGLGADFNNKLNVGKLGQTGQNVKYDDLAKNEVNEMNLDINQLDAFVKEIVQQVDGEDVQQNEDGEKKTSRWLIFSKL